MFQVERITKIVHVINNSSIIIFFSSCCFFIFLIGTILVRDRLHRSPRCCQSRYRKGRTRVFFMSKVAGWLPFAGDQNVRPTDVSIVVATKNKTFNGSRADRD